MTLEDVKHLTKSDVREFKTVQGNFGASLERCEVKDGPFLRGTVGFGETAEEALEALAANLSNETIIKNAYSDRQEFNLPTVTV